jgi:hypothetical protein
MSALIKYDQARQALAACRNVDDIKDIRDKSEAMRLYAKQANDTELEQWAAEIKLRAQRAIGEISRTLEKQQGNAGKLPTGGKFKTEALADAGISTSTANRYEQLAAIPDAAVEAFIAKSKDTGKPVSAKAVMAQLAPKSAPAPVVERASDSPSDSSDSPSDSPVGLAGPVPAAAPAASTPPLAPTVPELAAPPAPAATPSADDIHDKDDTPDFVEKLREADDEISGLNAEIEALKQQIEIITKDDLAAEVVTWSCKYDQARGLAQQHFNDLVAEKKKASYYDGILTKLRKAAGVEKNAEIIHCIVRKSEA